MDSSLYSMEHLTLWDIKKIIDALGDFAESSLNSHSLAIIIDKSGEVTFTSCGWKLLSSSGFSYPVSKVVINSALKYTNLCGEDCRYFLFILRNMFSNMISNVNRNEEAFMRRKLIDEICSIKQVLPCIFKCVHNLPGFKLSNLSCFSKDLYSIVFTFMSARFSINVSKALSNLICDFVEKINCEPYTLKTSLEYIIKHFDIFCCKKLSVVVESRVSEGLLFFIKGIIPEFSMKHAKFIVVWDLSMKIQTEDLVWKITDNTFVTQLDSSYIYQKVFEYFKSQEIALILTPSASDDSLKLLCKKNEIFLFDRLEKDEIECLLSCFHLYALGSLNESLESQHIGEFNSAKSQFINKSHFLHLCCKNPVRNLTAYHILLSAPCNAIWKEYYLECLNCFKMIYQWLESDICSEKRCCKGKVVTTQIIVNEETECCSVCYDLNKNFVDTIKFGSFCDIYLHQNSGLLIPGYWEFLLKQVLEKNSENLSLSRNAILQALHFAVVMNLCKRIGVPFTKVKNIEEINKSFEKKCKHDDIILLESVICKEIMIFNILDLIVQLLKIGSIILVK